MAVDEMKAVNTFFRDTTLAIADIQRMVNQSRDAIADGIRRYIEDAAVGLEDVRLFDEDLDIALTRVDTRPAGSTSKATSSTSRTSTSSPTG